GGAAAVEQAHVLMAEQLEHPQGVRGPPVRLVAVDHHGGLAGDAGGVHELREALPVDVVAGDGIVEVEVPVDLHRAGDVAGLVEQHVLIGFDDDEIRGTTGGELIGEPLRGHELLGPGVVLQRRRRVSRNGHQFTFRRSMARGVYPQSVTERRWMALTVVRPTIAGPTSCSRRALTAATDPRRADGMSVVPLRWGAAPGTGSEPSGGEGGEGGAPRLRARLLRGQQLQQ